MFEISFRFFRVLACKSSLKEYNKNLYLTIFNPYALHKTQMSFSVFINIYRIHVLV